ncbi:MAG TPA: glycosyltransferase family 4 protein [Victivallales bacterium]|nr:glycosyltransferase family 4 protein [Victivallales bacterium]
MKIGFIEDTHLRGGTQIWVEEATKFLINCGEEVNIIAPENSFVANECKKHGANIYTYDWDDIVKNKSKYKPNWIEGLRNSDVAVCTVHPPRGSFHCSVFGAECIKQADLQTTLIPKTGTIVPEYLREFYVPDETINSTVISITDFTRKYLIDTYKIPAKKVELIYQGTEVDRFTSTDETKLEAVKRYPLPEKAGPILGSVGSFEERKGQVILLDAVKKLSKTTIPNIHAMLVGDGPDEEMLKNKVKEMELENNISFFPFTREPNFIFERLDILTLPSLYKEGLPNVLLEAMSMNLPCIASKMAGIPEIIFNGKTGYMVKPGDADQLVSAISELWSDKARYKMMGINARKLMKEQFDKKNQFNEFLKYFKSLK